MSTQSKLSRRTALKAGGAAAVLGLAPWQAARAQAQKFKFGAVLPMTGPFSQIGEFLKFAMMAGIAEANRRGGITGREIELIIRDDAGTPNRALLAAKELVGDQKVDFLYPEGVSGLALAVIPYATEQKMITMSNGSSPAIGDAAKFPFSFQTGDLAIKRVPAMVSAMRKMGATKVGILVSNNPATLALGERMAADLKPRYGIDMVGFRQFASDVKDLTSPLQALRDAGADFLVFDGAGKDNLRVVMSGLQTLGWKVRLLTEPGGHSGDLSEQIPKEQAAQFFSINYRVAVDTGDGNERVRAFIARHKEIAPIRNLPFGATTRDLVFLAKWAFDTAQSKYKQTDSATVKKVLEEIGSASFPDDYSLVLGNPGFTPQDHTTGNADYSKMWALMGVSSPVDGIYKGEALLVTDR
ncbi:MAG: ABC transporter substrate-binding protein [Pseudomonadota bacterium]